MTIIKEIDKYILFGNYIRRIAERKGKHGMELCKASTLAIRILIMGFLQNLNEIFQLILVMDVRNKKYRTNMNAHRKCSVKYIYECICLT